MLFLPCCCRCRRAAPEGAGAAGGSPLCAGCRRWGRSARGLAAQRAVGAARSWSSWGGAARAAASPRAALGSLVALVQRSLAGPQLYGRRAGLRRAPATTAGRSEASGIACRVIHSLPCMSSFCLGLPLKENWVRVGLSLFFHLQFILMALLRARREHFLRLSVKCLCSYVWLLVSAKQRPSL